MKKLLTLSLFALLLAGTIAIAADLPQYFEMRPRIVQGAWPTNGVLNITGKANHILLPQILYVDVNLANVTNTPAVTLYNSASASTFTIESLTAQVNGSEAPIVLSNSLYNVGESDVLKITSSATGTDATNMTYRVFMYDVILHK